MEEKAPAAAHYGHDTNGHTGRGICRNRFGASSSAKAENTPGSRVSTAGGRRGNARVRNTLWPKVTEDGHIRGPSMDLFCGSAPKTQTGRRDLH